LRREGWARVVSHFNLHRFPKVLWD
jgi:hypothetical protein